MHRVFLLPISNFQRPQDEQPSPKGTILGLGGYPSTSVLAGRTPAKIANIYMFALLADLRNALESLFVGLSKILDRESIQSLTRREPVKRAHRKVVGATLVCS